jgi:asparagine synthase (glutamine-hydrolysing)
MCGICGYISARPVSVSDAIGLRRVNAAMLTRGPDGAGEFSSGPSPFPPAPATHEVTRGFRGDAEASHALLAMRRLSIIDLTGGWQPLFSENRSLALVCNGEVYNFVELRRELEARGHRFATGSDCETILHLYEEHGPGCVQHLRGMYAFALWDSKRRRLMVGRDRMGEKPVYLYERPGSLLFASEMKALLASGAVPFELDAVGVNEYMHYQWVPEPRTAVAGVRKLRAGHYLLVDVDPWRVQEHCYWRMEDAPAVEGDPAGLIRRELDTISEQIIRSEVPVGVALSGGLDSSTIATLAARKYPGTMHAFSVGYKGRPRQDERGMARELAEHLGLPMHEIELDGAEMVDFFPRLCLLRDDPIADIAGHAYYHLNRVSREKGCPVLLQGQGGDELFWGYPWCVHAADESYRKAGRAAQGASVFARRYLPRSLSAAGAREYAQRMGQAMAGWRRLSPSRGAPDSQLVFYDLNNTFQAGRAAQGRVYTAGFRRRLDDGPPPEHVFRLERPWPDVGVAITGLISRTYLLENGIAQGDRLSMASSVELRLPLVDSRLVELVIGLRKARADHHLPPKHWLKEAVKDIIPEWVMSRRKRGFNPPTAQWGGALVRRHGAGLADGWLVSHGVLAPDAAREICAARSKFSAWHDVAFKALVLEMWCRGMAALASEAAGAEARSEGRAPELAAAG